MGAKCIGCTGKPKASYPTSSLPTQESVNWQDTTTIDYKRIQTKYKFTEEVIGAGNFGKVFLA